MIAIKLVDARRGLNIKCRELFKDEKIAEAIYRYLCDGIEECDDVEPGRKHGEWKSGRCSLCGEHAPFWSMASTYYESAYCPGCGTKMDGGRKDDDKR